MQRGSPRSEVSTSSRSLSSRSVSLRRYHERRRGYSTDRSIGRSLSRMDSRVAYSRRGRSRSCSSRSNLSCSESRSPSVRHSRCGSSSFSRERSVSFASFHYSPRSTQQIERSGIFPRLPPSERHRGFPLGPTCGAAHAERPWWRRRGGGGWPARGGGRGGRGMWRGRTGGPSFGAERGRHGYREYGNNSWMDRSPGCDSEEEYRRSRSRERARRKKQYETIQKYCKTSEGERQVFWDGFQWVRKTDREGQLMYDQQMNATRRARRLHVGNLPLQLEEATEDDFKRHMWHVMRLNSSCADPAVCPILHVWFARDRGGNYGFVEMASVEEAHAALRLDGMLWHGLPIRINRPTDWKNSVGDESVLGAFAGTSGLALAESLAAAAQQATVTGNDTGLVSLIASLPEDQRAAALDLVARHRASQRANHQHVDVIQSQIQADLLSGQPSRVVRIACPSKIERDEEYDEILSDILAECNKYGHALAALIIRPELEQLLPSVTVGDVYLEYASCIQADHIILTFSGRMYDGKPLQLQRFNELAWRQTFHQHATPLLNQVFEKALEGLQPANVPVTADVGVVAIEAAGGDKDKIAACTAGAAAALAFLNSGPQTTSRTSTQVPYGPQPQPQTEASSEEKNCKDAVGENDSTTQDPENHIHDDGSVTCGTVGRVSVSTTCSE
ncbi:putative splicing factor [Toxoplasma gondii FOU]|uniref:Putative splicing factor n=2 Tax=Toxoplasma gondii TaxID=5811 RepID=A0A086LHT6_TOXGO|nr:putative splicing factor [Toxoplasma gondii FOU]PUA91527.1 putative splicing factor [Toxoplasma gondii TgCATBr9]